MEYTAIAITGFIVGLSILALLPKTPKRASTAPKPEERTAPERLSSAGQDSPAEDSGRDTSPQMREMRRLLDQNDLPEDEKKRIEELIEMVEKTNEDTLLWLKVQAFKGFLLVLVLAMFAYLMYGTLDPAHVYKELKDEVAFYANAIKASF